MSHKERAQPIGATYDAGPAVGTVYPINNIQTDDCSTARALMSSVPEGKTVVFLDLWVSVDTACYLTVIMETTDNVLAGAYLPANGLLPLTLRGTLRANASGKLVYIKTSVKAKAAALGNYVLE